jgi:hypothetical protein
MWNLQNFRKKNYSNNRQKRQFKTRHPLMGSDFQSEGRGTQGCRKEVSGGQIWNDYLFIDVLLHKKQQIVIFIPAGVPPNFLKTLVVP